MKRTGAWLAVYALEQLGVTHTFGIPGVHNTEMYDELNKSDKVTPVLVTHECGGAFMADAVSRTGNSVGTLVIVPAAGVTHAMSGIAEAFLDGIPMLVISGGIRRDTGMSYQLHDIDQIALMKNVTKGAWLVEHHRDIVPVLFEAYQTAVNGVPGPVFVEIPVNLQLFRGEVDTLPAYRPKTVISDPDPALIDEAVQMLRAATKPGLFLGWGARDATAGAVALAEHLNAPVCTTLQGLSVFPGNHPLYTGMGFGPHAVPAGEEAFRDCDVLLAVGTRFSEIPTGSFGMPVPRNLIHVDIDPNVFSKNYPAKTAITSDAGLAMKALKQGLLDAATNLSPLSSAGTTPAAVEKGPGAAEGSLPIDDQKPLPGPSLQATADPSLQIQTDFSKDQTKDIREVIRRARESYFQEWVDASVDGRVNPALFFRELRRQLPDDAIMALDDGNHTFLAAELFPVHRSKHLICPTDFNCMGYCVPAAIGAKLANPGKQVAGIVGDGAFLMTGNELITATMNQLGVTIFVFHDGELSQISQGQEIPYNRKTCTVLGEFRPEGIALATGAAFFPMNTNSDIERTITDALAMAATGRPVVVDVRIDYSKRTRFTKGVVKTNLNRFPLAEKTRFIGRALWRKIFG
jgi:acetolactate synthase I/II/III large subunit